MSWNPWQVAFTLAGGLALAAIIGWIKKSRLTVFVPRLFSHSVLTAKGQLAEISVFNRGLKTEEAIEISLNPNLDYEIVGSNSPSVEIRGKTIAISRIGAGDDATVILLIEGGVFSQSDIINCLSKETKGVVVSSLEKIPLTGQQRIGSVVVLLLFGLGVYGFNYGLEQYFSPASKASSAPSFLAPQAVGEVDGWVIPELYQRPKSALYSAAVSRNLTVAVGTPVRKGELLSIPLKIRNSTSLIVEASISFQSEASSKIPSYKLREHGVFIPPSGEVERSIAVAIPSKGSKPSEKNVYMEVFLQEHGGDSMRLTKVYVLE